MDRLFYTKFVEMKYPQESLFTAENAEWARDFFARRGEFSQAYFVYVKKIQRSMAEKDPPRRHIECCEYRF